MKIHNVLQSSPEWHALRLGIPTASAMHRVVTPKGNPSGKDTQDKFLLELLAERVTGHPASDFKSKAMVRGQTEERDAIHFYQLQRGLDTTPVGFVTNDAGTIGASPDQFVDEDGQMEIKIPDPGNHLGFLLGYGSAYEEHKVQVQTQLWITGRRWNDVVSYNRVMPMALSRIARDEKFIAVLEEIVLAFSARLEAKAKELSGLGWMDAAKAKNAEPVFSKETDRAYEAWMAGQSN